MNCTPNFEEIRPLEPDIEQFPCCGINEQRNATRQVDFQLRDNNTTGMCPEQDFRSGAGHLQTPGVACPLLRTSRLSCRIFVFRYLSIDLPITGSGKFYWVLGHVGSRGPLAKNSFPSLASCLCLCSTKSPAFQIETKIFADVSFDSILPRSSTM